MSITLHLNCSHSLLVYSAFYDRRKMEKSYFDSATGIVLIGACKFNAKYYKSFGIPKEIVCRFWYDEKTSEAAAK